MPDACLYLKAISISASVSTLFMLALVMLRGRHPTWRLEAANILGAYAGIMAGYYVLSWRTPWPPANALDRLLAILLPLAIVLEIVADTFRSPRFPAAIFRAMFAVFSGWLLFYGSVYFSNSVTEFTTLRLVATLLFSSLILLFVWTFLLRMATRAPGAVIPWTLFLSLLTSGFIVMMAGYIKGGGVAFLIAFALAGPAAVGTYFGKAPTTNGLIGLGVIALFGILFVGRFFGRLNSEQAIVVMVSPLSGWVAELPVFRNQKSWVREAIRFSSVAIPLACVLFFAKLRFDRDFAPLLAQAVSTVP